MSRLFSRLENIGHDHDEGAPSALPDEQGRQADTHDRSAAPDAPFSPTTRGAGGNGPPSTATARAPTIPPLVPGYPISSSLAMPQSGVPVAARPVWPVRIWLASLLLPVGLSLLILAMPDQLLPLAQQQQQQKKKVQPPERAPAAPSAAILPASPAAVVRPDSPAAPSASAIVTPLPAAHAPRAETHSAAVAPVPAALPRSNEIADCSDAMLAMNLCSTSSP